MAVQDPETKAWTVPFVIEPAAGVDRGVMALLCEAYAREAIPGGGSRIVLKLRPHLSPLKAAVIVLEPGNPDVARAAADVVRELRRLDLGRIVLETRGEAARLHAKHDEAGTPCCIGVSSRTLEARPTVIARDRDTMSSERILVDDLPSHLARRLAST
jgi:glycyl-tRNA synthetase